MHAFVISAVRYCEKMAVNQRKKCIKRLKYERIYQRCLKGKYSGPHTDQQLSVPGISISRK